VNKKYDEATIRYIIEDITYLQLDESDKSYGFSSDRMREYLKVNDINHLLREKLREIE
jgi:hypothetical protein